MENNKISKQETDEEGKWLPKKKVLNYLNSILMC